jgi:F-type H+-transporting ATPase subunit epsilon
MPDTIELEIATPERLLVREEVTEVQLPGKSGYMGILPGHAALLSQLGTGFLSYTVSGRKRSLSVQGGFVEVLPDHVRVLANIAERAEEIDVDRAKEDLKTAQEQVINAALGVDPAVALDAMAWAQARVDAAAQK